MMCVLFISYESALTFQRNAASVAANAAASRCPGAIVLLSGEGTKTRLIVSLSRHAFLSPYDKEPKS